MRSERDLTTVATFSQPIIGPPLYTSTRSRVLNYAGNAIFIITLLVIKLFLQLCADGVLPRIWIGLNDLHWTVEAESASCLKKKKASVCLPELKEKEII